MSLNIYNSKMHINAAVILIILIQKTLTVNILLHYHYVYGEYLHSFADNTYIPCSGVFSEGGIGKESEYFIPPLKISRLNINDDRLTMVQCRRGFLLPLLLKSSAVLATVICVTVGRNVES